jgi:SAM-dependent methyltransferase
MSNKSINPGPQTAIDPLEQKLQQWRPSAWEDDISIKTLDNQPFASVTPIGELDFEKAKSSFDRQIDDSLRGGKSLQEFIERDPYPIPGNDDRENYMRDHHESFWVMGLQDYLKVKTTSEKHQVNMSSILEMGCATGRVLRHFCAQGDYDQIWGSDINYRHVRWVSQNLGPKVRMLHSHTLPYFPIADNSLDLVCAFSVFSHIDVFETSWIAEIARILKPGGIAYLTTHTEHSWESLRDQPNSRMVETIKKSGLYTEGMLEEEMPGDRVVFRYTSRGPYRGSIFQSERYLRDIWGRFLNILEIIPNYHGVCQTVVVLQK